MGALNKGNGISILLVAVSCFVLVDYMLPGTLKWNFGEGIKEISSMNVFCYIDRFNRWLVYFCNH